MANNRIFTAEWFPYYFERFEGSDRVALMSLSEEGAYHRALRIAWKYGSIPSDPKILALKIQKRCTISIAKKVLSAFEPMPNNPRRMIHPVLETIRTEQKQKHLSKVKAGKASGAIRATKAVVNTVRTPFEHRSNTASTDIDIDIDIKRLIRRAREAHSKLDPRIVEIGILYTLLQRNGVDDPIRSIRYFDPEIKRIARDSKTLSDNAINILLRRRREQYQAQRQSK